MAVRAVKRAMSASAGSSGTEQRASDCESGFSIRPNASQLVCSGYFFNPAQLQGQLVHDATVTTSAAQLCGQLQPAGVKMRAIGGASCVLGNRTPQPTWILPTPPSAGGTWSA